MHLAGPIALYPISARRAGAARRVGAGVAIPAPPNQEWHRESDRCKKRNCIVMQECIVRLGESDALLLSCRHSHGWAGGGRVTECHRESPPVREMLPSGVPELGVATQCGCPGTIKRYKSYKPRSCQVLRPGQRKTPRTLEFMKESAALDEIYSTNTSDP